MLTRRSTGGVWTCGVLTAVLLTGCFRPVSRPDYDRPLPPGVFALRPITDPARLPDMAPVVSQLYDPSFREAQRRSLEWFAIESTQQFYPVGPISHAHAWASVYALGQIDTIDELLREFDVWESVGWNMRGDVFYTAYFSPQFRGSLTRTAEYRYPLYMRPTDLVSDPRTGQVLGRRTPSGIVPYPSRAQIESRGLLNGQELVYLPSALDAFIAHVNGSAQITLTDGKVLYVGYAGTNGREYTSVGQLMAQDGVLESGRVSLPAIRGYFRAHPDKLDRYLRQNERFVFFQEYTGDDWPAGSLGFQVTPMRTLATDKAIFPRGCAVYVDTTFPTPTGGKSTLRQLMLDQDTGGAIRAAGRGDIYVGIGDTAEQLAGRQAAEGRLYYLLLKPDRVHDWYTRLMRGQP